MKILYKLRYTFIMTYNFDFKYILLFWIFNEVQS
jgi:hypothetical protein